MLPPCFRLGERVFPLVRQEAAHRLAQDGHTQKQIGACLGVSQAMVSKYLKAGAPKLAEEDQWIVRQMAQEITLQQDPAAPKANSDEPATNPWCRTLGLITGEHQQDRRHIVATLLTTLQRIQHLPLAPLVPNVGMNLAGALPAVRERSDVAAFPGRLAHVQGTLRAHAPPEFGASHHLAALLKTAQRGQEETRLVINLAGRQSVIDAAKATETTLVTANGEDRDDAGVARFEAPDARFALLDPGGFGIEPALYLVDKDADALIQRIQRLAHTLEAGPEQTPGLE